MATDSYGQGVPYLDYSDKPDLVVLGSGIVNALTQRSVMRFTDGTARASTITTPTAGMLTWNGATGRLEYWDGTSWQSIEQPHVLAYTGSTDLTSDISTYYALNLGAQVTSNRSDMFDPAHPTRLAAPTAGTYTVDGVLVWPGTLGTADGRAEFRQNGSGTPAPYARFSVARGSSGNAASVASGRLIFTAPGYVEVFANQHSGGTVTLSASVGIRRISTST